MFNQGSSLIMEFTEKEIRLIKAAENTVHRAKYTRILLLIALIITISLFFMNKLDGHIMAYLAFGAAILALLATQVGMGPKYEELVTVLSNKYKNQPKT